MPQIWGPTLNPSPHLKKALIQHVINERQKKKTEAEQHQAANQQRLEREQRKKRDAQTLEHTSKQLCELREEMGELQKERHQLWAQLKQVLGAEEEHKKRLQAIRQQKEKDISEVLSKVGGGGPASASVLPQLMLDVAAAPSGSGLNPPPPPPRNLQPQHRNPHKRPHSPSGRSQQQPSYASSASPFNPVSPCYLQSPASSTGDESSTGGPLPPPPPPPKMAAGLLGAKTTATEPQWSGALPPPPPPPTLQLQPCVQQQRGQQQQQQHVRLPQPHAPFTHPNQHQANKSFGAGVPYRSGQLRPAQPQPRFY